MNNDDEVLALAAKIKQLQAADADVTAREGELATAKARRDKLKAAVDRLRSGATPKAAAASAAGK
ncbi:MAG: hypothetical protein JWO31_891 [Phycisphaerales bacterium]|nr:hypothetical protein [Phycisphaerales bacterium]